MEKDGCCPMFLTRVRTGFLLLFAGILFLSLSHIPAVLLVCLAAIAACAAYTDQLYEYTPMQVKQALVGYGNATKHQVQDMTKRLLHLNAMPKPDDAADAIAIALCHARSSTSLLAQANVKLKM